jgi:photosystem II stability/assembly factor-like uncharacterized protein
MTIFTRNGLLTLLSVLFVAVANASATELQHFQTFRNTDYAVAGVGGLRNVGSGAITLSGVSGAIQNAYLYWNGPTNSSDPNVNASVVVNGTTIVGSNIGFSDDNCWGFANSQTYRADVTTIVSSTGNGVYTLSSFLKPTANVNGASLLVLFDDGNGANNHDVILFNGNDSNIASAFDSEGWNAMLSSVEYKAGTVTLQLHVADGQAFIDGALIINGITLVPSGANFSGNSVPSANNGPQNDGSLWDIRTFDITSFLVPGQNNLNFTSPLGGDCLGLVAALIDLPAGSIEPSSWQRLQGPWPASCDGTFGAIAVDEANPNTIYIGSSAVRNGCGVYKSTDGGQTWLEKNQGIKKLGLFTKTLPTISTITIAPSNPEGLYVGTFNDGGFGTVGFFYRSTDGGNSWVEATGTRNFLGVPQIQGGVLTADVSPNDPFKVYLSAAGQGIYKSTDGGAAWDQIRADAVNSYHIVRVGVLPNLFAAGGQALRNSPCIPIVVNRRVPGICNGTLPIGPLRSTDDGDSWQGIPLENRVFATALVIDPVNSSKMYFSTMGAGLATPFPILIDPQGVLKSTDGGNTWFQINNGFPQDLSSFPTNLLAIDPGTPSRLLVLRPPDVLYQSVDEGGHWAPLSKPDGVSSIQALDIGSNHRVYILTRQGIYARTP